MEFVQNLFMHPTTIEKISMLILLVLVFSIFVSLSWLILFIPGKTVVDVLKFSFIVSLLGVFEPLLYMYFTFSYICYLATQNAKVCAVTGLVSAIVMTILFVCQKFQLLLIYNIILCVIATVYKNKKIK